LKPQDVALLVKLLVKDEQDWKQMDIAQELGISQGEVAKALVRLKKAMLISGKRINRQAALEFLVHAIKYVFPVELGPLAFGVPTGISSPAHYKMVVQSGDDVYVRPHPTGKKRGQIIRPFYAKLAEAALKDRKFYDIMSAIEILRVGRARERNLAVKYLEKELQYA
jgi:DNA-binding Lrp family transcriptional regulator